MRLAEALADIGSVWMARYARDVIKGPWPEAEDAIAECGLASYWYALDVIGKRWQKGEPAIAQFAGDGARSYYCHVFNLTFDPATGTFTDLPAPKVIESELSTPQAMARYAREVIKGPWPEAEPTIIEDPATAYFYASGTSMRRYPPDLEKKLAKVFCATNSPTWATLYAFHVVKGRWKEIEPYLARRALAHFDKYCKKYGLSYTMLTRKYCNQLGAAPSWSL